MAVTQNEESLVIQLLDLGASLATQDLQGRTPLMTACEYGHMQALESLATRGVNMAGIYYTYIQVERKERAEESLTPILFQLG